MKFLSVFQIPSNSVQIPKVAAGQAQLDSALNGAFMIAGAIAVLFIIIGALRYVTSQGNSDATRTAREMIIYSVVGLVLVSLGFALVRVVILVVNS
jgi:uncharacterized membrane protein YidH (DUF202 family)